MTAAPRLLRTAMTIIVVASCAVRLASAPQVGTTAPAPGAVAPTYTTDVAPLLAARCGSCHYPSGPAPFSVFSYDAVRPYATQIADVTRRGYMPPWRAEPTVDGEFAGQQHLSASEIDLLGRWASAGAPQGDGTLSIPVPVRTAGWQLGAPDLVVTTPAYTLAAEGTDVFRIFVIPLPVSALRFVRGLEFRPGNPRVVHHANIRVDRTRASRLFDEGDPLPGYDGLIAHSAVYPDGHFLGWTPGQVAPFLPKGLAWRLNPGSDLVVEIHMQPTGKPEDVVASIGLYFGDDPPVRTPSMLRLGRQSIDIPAGESQYTITDSFVLPVDVEMQAVQPHAHYRARTLSGTATLPDGRTRSLIEIRDWDFRWQHVYRYPRPFTLPKGTTVSMRYTYDNSAENPRNPVRPPRRVYWGQRSADEMGDLWMQVLTSSDADLETLNRAFAPKIMAEDVIGYERWIQSDPKTLALHDDVGVLYLQLNRPNDAVRHFGIVTAFQPASAAAHFNLATALTMAGQLTTAIAEYTKALALRPDYAQAHNNLGSILLRTGKLDEAVPHLTAAARIDPASAQALYNLGSAHYQQRKSAEAIAAFKRSLQVDADQPAALADLAWLLAVTADPALRAPILSVQLAERAVLLTGRQQPAALDVLAAAYASAGDFARAVSSADAALALAPPNATQITARRDLYRRQEPYRLSDR